METWGRLEDMVAAWKKGDSAALEKMLNEMRQEAPSRCLRHQKKHARESRAGNAADRGKENDPDEQGQGLCASLPT